MEMLFKIDWHSMFVPTESILEVVIRGTIMYLGMYFILRIFRRQSGSIGVADLLVIVVIADAAQNGMAGKSESITEALLLIVTIVLWDFFLDWLGFKSTFVARFLTPKPLLLIENGKFIKKNLDKEFLTVDEVYSQLREQGLEDASKVKQCYLESNGHFSVLLGSTGKSKQEGNESGSGAVN
jgi:uncharacterized membrane protein YcaP (DUF421 family)